MHGDVMFRDYGRAKMNQFQQGARTEQLCAEIEARSTAMGARREFTAKVRELVAGAGDSVREQFASDEVVQDYVRTIHAGIKTGDRTSLRLYSEVMKLVGEERRITVEFIHSLGARSEEELRQFVDAAKGVEGMGPHESAQRCAEWLVAYFNVHPERKAMLIKFMGGLVPVEMG